MSLCLKRRIIELKASEFNLDLRGGKGEPLVVTAETAALCLSVLTCRPTMFTLRSGQIFYFSTSATTTIKIYYITSISSYIQNVLTEDISAKCT